MSGVDQQPFLGSTADSTIGIELGSGPTQAELDAKAQMDETARRRSRYLVISFVLMMFVGLGNKIFQVVMLIPMVNYPMYVSLLTTTVYLPACFIYIWPMILWGKAITAEQRAIPMRVWMIMGGLDALAGIMQTLSINYIANGTLVTLVMQMAIPISMVISKYLLGAKYRKSQYAGCGIVALGLATVLIPRFAQPKSSDGCESGPDSVKLGISILVLVLSVVPMCLSNVIKERSLGDQDVDAVYLNGWVAVYQFILSFPLMLPAAASTSIPIKDLPENLWNGMKCGVGINTKTKPANATQAMITAVSSTLAPMADSLGAAVTSSSAFSLLSNAASGIVSTTSRTAGETVMADMALALGYGSSASNGTKDCDKEKYDDCTMSPVYIAIYIVFNLFYNLLIILIIKYGSANLLWLAMTLMVPLVSIGFSIPIVPDSKSLSAPDVVGLFVIFGGLVVYRFYDQLRIRLCGKNANDIRAELEADEAEAQRQASAAGSSVNAIGSSPALSSRSGSHVNDEEAVEYYEPATEPPVEAQAAVAHDDEATRRKRSKSKRK